jgi:hypothetical protein
MGKKRRQYSEQFKFEVGLGVAKGLPGMLSALSLNGLLEMASGPHIYERRDAGERSN